MVTMRRGLTFVSLAGLVVVLAWGGWRSFSAMQRGAAADEEGPLQVTADVEIRTLERTVATRGVVGFGSQETLVAAASGRVTAVPVSVGSLLQQHDRIVEIDGRPVLAVEAPRPLWRDLGEGDTGTDVASLQLFLRDAGYLSIDPDGRFGSTTSAALRQWQEDHRYPDPDGILRINDWAVGQWPRRVGQIHVRTGGFVNPGSELVAVTRQTPSVSVELTPSDRIRVSPGDSAVVEVPATGGRIRARIQRVDATPRTKQDGSIVYPAIVMVGKRLDVPEGTQVQVSIVVDRSRDAVAAPLASLVSDDQGGAAVEVVRSDGSLDTVAVEVGISDGAWVEIVKGLSGEESVLIAQ